MLFNSKTLLIYKSYIVSDLIELINAFMWSLRDLICHAKNGDKLLKISSVTYQLDYSLVVNNKEW